MPSWRTNSGQSQESQARKELQVRKELQARNQSLRQRLGLRGPRGVALAAGAAVALAGTVAGVAAVGSMAGREARPGVPAAGHTEATTAKVAAARDAAAGSAAAGAGGTAGVTVRGRTGAPAPAASPRTSCTTVAHIGDSTSVDLISSAFIPDPAQRLAAQYARVGVGHLKIDASGGRSIVEEMPGQVNGYRVASAWRSQGYHGCWVFALGTNDAANVSAGSSAGMMARIDQMMSVAHGQPVMWVNTRTLLSSGAWANANEQAWDKTLVRALAIYPNMRIFNWSAVAQPGWFRYDGIHYTSHGAAMRAHAIAGALALAFPAGGHSAGKIVR